MLLLLFNTVGPCAKSPYDAPHTTRRRPRPRPRPRAGGIWLGREQAVRVKRPYLASVSGHARARVFGHSTSRTTQRWLLKLNVGLLLLAAPTVVLLLLLTLCTLFSAQRYTSLVRGGPGESKIQGTPLSGVPWKLNQKQRPRDPPRGGCLDARENPSSNTGGLEAIVPRGGVCFKMTFV